MGILKKCDGAETPDHISYSFRYAERLFWSEWGGIAP